MANYRVDLLLVAAFASVADVGVYTVAVTAAEFLWLVPSASGGRSWSGSVGEARSTTTWPGWRAPSRPCSPRSGSVACSRCGSWPGRSSVRGSSARGCSCSALLPGVVVLGACKPVASALLAKGLVSANLRASAAGLIVLVGSGFVLVPSHGVLGAAAASSASYLVTALLVVRTWRRSTRAPALDADAVVFASTS